MNETRGLNNETVNCLLFPVWNMKVSFNASRPVKMFQYRGDDQQESLNVYKATSGPSRKKGAGSDKHGSFYTDWYAQRIKVVWKEAEAG